MRRLELILVILLGFPVMPCLAQGDVCSIVRSFVSDGDIPVLQDVDLEWMFRHGRISPAAKQNTFFLGNYVSYARCGDKALFRVPVGEPSYGDRSSGTRNWHPMMKDPDRDRTFVPPINGYFETTVTDVAYGKTSVIVCGFLVTGVRLAKFSAWDGTTIDIWEILATPSGNYSEL